jgi:hypothetical protein
MYDFITYLLWEKLSILTQQFLMVLSTDIDTELINT